MLLAILGSRLSLHVASLRYIRLAKYCKYLIHFLAVVIVFNRQKNDFLANFYVCSPLPSNDKPFFFGKMLSLCQFQVVNFAYLASSNFALQGQDQQN